MYDSELKVICLNCKKKYKIKNPHSIKKYSCKQCGEEIIVNPFSEIIREYKSKIKFSDNFLIPVSSIFIKDGFALADKLNYIIKIYY